MSGPNSAYNSASMNSTSDDFIWTPIQKLDAATTAKLATSRRSSNKSIDNTVRRTSLYGYGNGDSFNKSKDMTSMHSRSSGIKDSTNKSFDSSLSDRPKSDIQAPFLDLEDSDDEDPWDEETEQEEARLKNEEEAVGIASAMAKGGKPRAAGKKALLAGKAPARGPSLKKWFKDQMV
jgi:hypothetical protein